MTGGASHTLAQAQGQTYDIQRTSPVSLYRDHIHNTSQGLTYVDSMKFIEVLLSQVWSEVQCDQVRLRAWFRGPYNYWTISAHMHVWSQCREITYVSEENLHHLYTYKTGISVIHIWLTYIIKIGLYCFHTSQHASPIIYEIGEILIYTPYFTLDFAQNYAKF